MSAVKPLRVVVPVVLTGVGLALGLGIAEYSFAKRDAGAFPQVNCYTADDALGARLTPGCTEKIRFGTAKNPVTTAVIGADGFREAPHVAKENADEILVVGDSQVFGLGVEAGETFSARLEEKLVAAGKNVRVRNLGVPTYGPDEYLAVAEAEAAKGSKKPKTIIFTVNLVNDLFEATRPNKGRHAVVDGWAIRAEQAPDARSWLPTKVSQRSHLVYAWRRWRHAAKDQESVPSEGGYADLVGLAGDTSRAETDARNSYETAILATASSAKTAYDAFVAADRALNIAVDKALVCKDSEKEEFSCSGLFPEMRPGDYLERFNRPSEYSRPTRVTAEHLHRAALSRAYAEGNEKGIAELEASVPTLKPLADARRAAEAKYKEILGNRPVYTPPPTPLSPVLAKLAAFGRKEGVHIVVAVLPIDVVVAKSEWAKYDVANGPDLSAVETFGQALIARARREGVAAIDLLEPLRGASPGAFLDRDIHMTAKGHTVVADALLPIALPGAVPAEKTAEKTATGAAATATPTPALAVDRWFYRSVSSFKGDYNLTHNACVESGGATSGFWTLLCPLTDKEVTWVSQGLGMNGPIGAADFLNLDENEFFAGKFDKYFILAAPLTVSRPLYAVIRHGAENRSKHAFTVAPTEYGVTFDVRVGAEGDAPRPPVVFPPSDPRFEACARELPSEPVAPSNADCVRTYEKQCALMLACARGATFAPPRCEPGFVNVAPTGRCFPTCEGSKEKSCTDGRSCVEKDGAKVCLRKAQNVPVPDYRTVVTQWGTYDPAKNNDNP